MIYEGANDVLRGLLGYGKAIYFEASISHDDGDVVSAGYFSFPRGASSSVKVIGVT